MSQNNNEVSNTLSRDFRKAYVDENNRDANKGRATARSAFKKKKQPDIPGNDEQAQRIQALESEKLTLQNEVSQFNDMMQDGKYIYFQGCELSRTGIQIPDNLEPEEWATVGSLLRDIDIALQWMIGDWFVYGSANFNLDYETFAEEIGFSIRTLQQYKYVAENVDSSVRTEKLSFTHHQLVASLRNQNNVPDVEQQSYWINQAVSNGWTVKQMRDAMTGKTPAAPGRYFKAVDSLRRRFKSWIPAMPSQDRKVMADQLRKLADELEKG
ncbi:MAG: hypothetical protein ACPG7F_09620 [Aggregatilineales bacterium]